MSRTLEQVDADLAALEASFESETTPSRAELANRMSSLLDKWQAREAEFRAWMTGVIDGGPNGDGFYPLTDASGYTQLAACPAKLRDITQVPIQHLTPSSPSLAIDAAEGEVVRIALNASSLALTVGSAVTDTAHEQRLKLYLVQDAAGGRLVGWPANIMWNQQRAPILSVTPNYTDIVELSSIDGGLTWFGSFAGVGFSL